MTREDITDLAAALWRGMPFLWQVELDAFLAYELVVQQEVTEEGLKLWMERVQARQCPVAGTGCDKPSRGRFCGRHHLFAIRKPDAL